MLSTLVAAIMWVPWALALPAGALAIFVAECVAEARGAATRPSTLLQYAQHAASRAFHAVGLWVAAAVHAVYVYWGNIFHIVERAALALLTPITLLLASPLAVGAGILEFTAALPPAARIVIHNVCGAILVAIGGVPVYFWSTAWLQTYRLATLVYVAVVGGYATYILRFYVVETPLEKQHALRYGAFGTSVLVFVVTIFLQFGWRFIAATAAIVATSFAYNVANPLPPLTPLPPPPAPRRAR